MMARINFRRFVFPFFLLGLLTPVAHGQTTTPKTSKTKAAEAKARAAAAARKIRAKQLIEEVVADSKLVDSLADRAEIQAEAAYELWPADRNRARVIFRMAWDAASTADKESLKIQAESKARDPQASTHLSFVRGYVLENTAARDRALADEFLSDYASDPAAQTDRIEVDASDTDPWGKLSPEAAQRFNLAFNLLENGEPAQAIQIASPAFLERFNWRQIYFVSELWKVDPVNASRLYIQLIEQARRDPATGANDVLLLSTPVVSPGFMFVVDDQGGVRTRVLGSSKPIPIAPGVRQDFLNVAAEILMRPIMPETDEGRSPGAYASYYAGERLLPYFDREAPQFSGPVRLRNSSLANEIGAAWTGNLDQRLVKGEYPVNRQGDPLRNQLDELEEITDTGERDRILMEIVVIAANRLMWDRAKENADKINNQTSRRSAFSYIQLCQIADLTRAAKEDREADYLGFASFVRKADVPPVVTAWGLAQTALIANRLNHKTAATALFNEASICAGKTEAGTYQRIAAYAMLANLLLQHEQKQAWFSVPEIIQAVNSLGEYSSDRDFHGVFPDLSSSLRYNDAFLGSLGIFQLDYLFAALANLDFDRAADFARGFGTRMARIEAVMAVARVELDRK